jgi:hypothetical protein
VTRNNGDGNLLSSELSNLPLFNLEIKKLISEYLQNTGRLDTSWPIGALISSLAA